MAENEILGAIDAVAAEASQNNAQIKDAASLMPLVRVPNPSGTDLIQMEPWPLHVDLLTRFWPEHKRTVILKPRQMGLTLAMALFCLYECGWKRYRNIASVNYTREAAGELIRRMRILWYALPPNLRPPLAPGKDWAGDHVEFHNGSRMTALATTDVSGAGQTFSGIVIDEAGLIKTLEDNWAALLPAVDQGWLHVFSTPRGSTGKFAELVAAARASQGPFRFRFINYWERPGRAQNTEQGRAWLAARKAELSEREFAREYLGEFQRPGESFFDDETIKRLRANAREPLEIAWRGRLRIHERPGSEPAVIGADCAEGLANGDASAAHVMGRYSGKVLASYHARVPPSEYAEDLVRLARLYGHAWLGIEANNHGHAVAQWAYKHLKYRRVFRESSEDAGGLGAPVMRLGITTTLSTKPAMLTDIEDGLRRGRISLHDLPTIEELAVFIALPDGGYGNAPGHHDDRVMALAIAQACRRRPFPRAV